MQSSQQPFNPRTQGWKQFKKNKPALLSLYILIFLTMIAVLAPLLANDRPLYMKVAGQNLYPIFSHHNSYGIKNSDGTTKNIQIDIAEWKLFKADKILQAPVVYSPGKGDYYNYAFVSPFGYQKFLNDNGDIVRMPPRYRHWLGTGQRGDDLLSGLIHGTRISLTIGFISMGISTLIGILVGAFAGFFGDDKLITSRGKFIMWLPGLFVAWFYGFQTRTALLSEALRGPANDFIIQLTISILIFSLVVSAFLFIGKMVEKLPWLRRKMLIPADTFISRLIEIFVSLPIFLLIIAVAAISRPSMLNLMVIIGLTNWTGIARLTRAEMLRIRNLEFIQSAQALGYSKLRIIVRHALPNALAPALISISFGVANAILIESGLSFIGLGVPPDVVTWGSLLNAGRGNFDAWWMVLFPGLCIFITVTTYNLIGEGLRDALDPKLKT